MHDSLVPWVCLSSVGCKSREEHSIPESLGDSCS